MNEILDLIRAEIKAILGDTVLQTEPAAPVTARNNGTIQLGKINVVDGWLPPKRDNGAGNDEPDFPYVIVRPAGGTDGDRKEGAQLRVKIYFGAYADDPQGFKDTLMLLERIKKGLVERGLIGGKAELAYPLEWEIDDEQPFPFWIAKLTTRWNVAGYERVGDV